MSPLDQEKAALFATWKRAARLHAERIAGNLGVLSLEGLNHPASRLYTDALEACQAGVEPSRFVNDLGSLAERIARMRELRNEQLATWRDARMALGKTEQALQALETLEVRNAQQEQTGVYATAGVGGGDRIPLKKAKP